MYHLRDVSEKQYMIIKFQPGYDATRVHSTEEIENKFTVCFIAFIIRSEICWVYRKLWYDSNRMIREIDRAVLVLMPDGLYACVNNLSNRQKELLMEFSVYPEHFKEFADDVNCGEWTQSTVRYISFRSRTSSLTHKKRGTKKKPVDDILPVSKTRSRPSERKQE